MLSIYVLTSKFKITSFVSHFFDNTPKQEMIMSKLNNLTGNFLGGPRAEVDERMLENAFVATHDFQALVATTDFNFVVGRRGTGKSALYKKVSEFIAQHKKGYIYCKSPSEHEALELQGIINKMIADYKTIRALTRVVWKISLLYALLDKIKGHYKFQKCESYKFLMQMYGEEEKLCKLDCFKRTSEIIKRFYSEGKLPEEMISEIVSHYKLDKLQNGITETLKETNRGVYFFFDGLDEGWKPDEKCTAIIGGLAAAAADFSEKKSGIHLVMFIRDNIFRSLNYFDKDSSRHIEGNTLRLNWDSLSLLHLISNRLRVALDIEQESDIKVWNRFGYGDLKGRGGFESCLNYTLYRPRDLIVLLNFSFTQAARSGRKQLIQEDIDIASKQISTNRLGDLLKEYDVVFPGLKLFVELFRGKPAFQSFSKIVSELDHEIEESSFEVREASDFAVFGTGKAAFYALYGIGFIGLENPATKNIRFCHDGSHADIDALKADQKVCVHPCYWKALDIQSGIIEEDIKIELYDDNKPPPKDGITDQRVKMIGQLVSLLPSMPEGIDHASEFEDWTFRAIQILFSGTLVNPELKPNGDSLQRRDIVATNMAEKGFWRRVYEDYEARQIIIEVKNYATLKPDDFRQVLSYTGGQYGKFVVVVNRSENEGLTKVEQDWVKEMWDTHKILVFVVPAVILSRCIGKLRKKARFDYAEDQLAKRLDTFLRSYISLRHRPKSKRKKGK